MIISITILFILWIAKQSLQDKLISSNENVSTTDFNNNTNNNIPTENLTMTLKEETFNSDNLINYQTSNKNKKFIYRPQTFDDYIGQYNAKKILELNIKKIKLIKPIHILLSGRRGYGKTTLARIIANNLGAKIIEIIGSQISTTEELEKILNQITSSQETHVILFIDEIETLKYDMCKYLNPILEDFKINDKNIKPFTLIGATINKSHLVKKVDDFVSRFQVQIEMERYSQENIVTILKNYRSQLFPEYNINQNIYEQIANNCRYTPRTAIALLEDVIIENNISQILTYHRIIKNSLTNMDIKILQILHDNEKPIGASALSQMSGLPQSDYEQVNEPFLIEEGYILRSNRGRIITKKGNKFLLTI